MTYSRPRIRLRGLAAFAPGDKVVAWLGAMMCAASCPHPLLAQPKEVPAVIRIVDDRSMTPIAGAVLHLLPSARTTTSDRAGQATFALAARSRETLTVRRIGFAPSRQDVLIGPGDTVVVLLTATVIELGPVEVNERQGMLGDAFRPTTVLDGAALDRERGGSIAAAIAALPGVTQRYNGPLAAQPVVRGLTGDRVPVVEDGLRTGDIATTAPDHAVTVEPLAAHRIEVIRGPAGLLFGTATLGGVVNVVREEIAVRRPEHLSAQIATQAESVNRGVSAHGLALGTLGGSIVLRGEGSMRHASDTRTPGGMLPFTDLDGFELAGSAAWIGSRGRVGAALREYRTFYGVPSSFNGVTLPGSHDGGVYVDIRRTTARWEAGYRPADSAFITDVRGRGNYVRYEHDELERGGFVGTRFGQLAAFSEGVAHFARGRHRGAVGLSGQWRDFRAVGSFTGTRPAVLRSAAMVVFDEARFGRIRLAAAVREDVHRVAPLDSTETRLLRAIRTRRFAALSGAVGATAALSGGFEMGASVARAFRPPAIEELYSAGPHLASYAYEIGNPALRPEVATGLDLFLRIARQHVAGDVAVFANRLSAFIGYEPQIDSTGAPVRDPRLRRYVVYRAAQADAMQVGAEGSLQLEPRPGVALDFSASALRARWSVTGEALPMMPPARLRAGLRQHTGVWHWGAGVERVFAQRAVPRPPSNGDCGLRPGGDAEELLPAEFCPTGGVVLLGAFMSRHWTHGPLGHSITLAADNLLGAMWHDHLWRAKEVAPQPGRNMRVTVRTGR